MEIQNLSVRVDLCIILTNSVAIVTSPQVGGKNIAISMYVCLTVCALAYLENCMSKFYQIFSTCCFHLGVCGCVSLLLWRQCNASCTSGFVVVDDVMFTLEQMGQSQRAIYFIQFARHWGRTLPSLAASCLNHCREIVIFNFLKQQSPIILDSKTPAVCRADSCVWGTMFSMGVKIGRIHLQSWGVTRQRCGLLPNYFGPRSMEYITLE